MALILITGMRRGTAATTAVEAECTGPMAPRVTGGVITRRQAHTRVVHRSTHRMEARRLVRPTIRAPEPMARLIKVRMPIRTGEVRPSRKTDNRLTHNTTPAREGRWERCRPQVAQKQERPAPLMATALQPRRQVAMSTLPIMATFIKTPAVVGRAPTNLVSTTPMRHEAGDKRKVLALLPLGIDPAVGVRVKQVRAVGQAVEAVADGVVEAALEVEVSM